MIHSFFKNRNFLQDITVPNYHTIKKLSSLCTIKVGLKDDARR
jgi:hypothetical protein